MSGSDKSASQVERDKKSEDRRRHQRVKLDQSQCVVACESLNHEPLEVRRSRPVIQSLTELSVGASIAIDD